MIIKGNLRQFRWKLNFLLAVLRDEPVLVCLTDKQAERVAALLNEIGREQQRDHRAAVKAIATRRRRAA